MTIGPPFLVIIVAQTDQWLETRLSDSRGLETKIQKITHRKFSSLNTLLPFTSGRQSRA